MDQEDQKDLLVQVVQPDPGVPEVPEAPEVQTDLGDREVLWVLLAQAVQVHLEVPVIQTHLEVPMIQAHLEDPEIQVHPGVLVFRPRLGDREHQIDPEDRGDQARLEGRVRQSCPVVPEVLAHPGDREVQTHLEGQVAERYRPSAPLAH